jgi:pyruvate dehydrogenase complex dehydrogenase (E1) component
MDQRAFRSESADGETRDWRKICEEMLGESSAERVNSLLEELLDALEERDRSKPPRAHRV